MALKNITTISHETKGEIEKNIHLMEHVPESKILKELTNTARSGTPLLRIGYGFPKVMITAGIHGNELPPQVAAIRLIEKLSPSAWSSSSSATAMSTWCSTSFTATRRCRATTR
jgi:predicted deacylase